MEHVTAPRSMVEAGMAAVSDSEDFFFLACGLGKYGSLTSRLRFAAMYPELHWPSPDGCFFLFHNRRAEFMRDLARIYADYHWGVDFLNCGGRMAIFERGEFVSTNSVSPVALVV